VRALAIAALLLAGCEIDTELGIAAEITSAVITVPSDASVSVEVDVDYRVGEHAEGERNFQPQAIEVYAGEELVAQITPELPAGFTPRIAPGAEASVHLTGSDDTVTDPRGLCGTEARILFRWRDATSAEVGMTEGVSDVVACD
jgi:hypothetical protein